VRASWGRVDFGMELEGIPCSGDMTRKAGAKSGAQEAAEANLREEERNLRRFISGDLD
jgi:hypothetical protein